MQKTGLGWNGWYIVLAILCTLREAHEKKIRGECTRVLQSGSDRWFLTCKRWRIVLD